MVKETFEESRLYIMESLKTNKAEHNELKELVNQVSCKLDALNTNFVVLETKAKLAGKIGGAWVSAIISLLVLVIGGFVLYSITTGKAMANEQYNIKVEREMIEFRQRIDDKKEVLRGSKEQDSICDKIAKDALKDATKNLSK